MGFMWGLWFNSIRSLPQRSSRLLVLLGKFKIFSLCKCHCILIRRGWINKKIIEACGSQCVIFSISLLLRYSVTIHIIVHVYSSCYYSQLVDVSYLIFSSPLYSPKSIFSIYQNLSHSWTLTLLSKVLNPKSQSLLTLSLPQANSTLSTFNKLIIMYKSSFQQCSRLSICKWRNYSLKSWIQ